MGTPETNTNKLNARFLIEAAQLPMEFSVANIQALLVMMREILQPMVQTFSQLLPKEFTISTRNIRAMVVHDDWGWGTFISLALDHKGQWHARVFQGTFEKGNDFFLEAADEEAIAKIIYKRIDILVKKFMGLDAFQEWLIEKEKLDFLTSPIQFAALLWFISKCSSCIEKNLKEREDRLRLMRERFNLLKDFAQTIDSLDLRDKSIRIEEKAIWSKHSGSGKSRSTSAYFHENALKPFYDILDSRNFGRTGYVEETSTSTYTSLSTFVNQFSYLFAEIHKVRKQNGEPDAKDFFGSNFGRMPISSDEALVLKEALNL